MADTPVEKTVKRAVFAIRDFLALEAAGGILLVAAAAIALVMQNSPAGGLYGLILSTEVMVQIGELTIDKPLLLWINDGLMAIFFLLVGLEIKRELLDGNLSSWEDASLPVIAAVGGMAVPALVYLGFNFGTPETLTGWAIPAATDIAFALGVLGLLGSRVPTQLKVFLLALAIIDDLGAIVIIAMFYTHHLSPLALVLAGVGLAGLAVLNRYGVMSRAPYMLIGLAIWVCVLKSGVHATLAGVAVALFIPLRGQPDGDDSPLERLEVALHPWVSYGIMPLFAFANAGVSFAGMALSDLLAPVPLGIAAGLFVGKQVGVMAFSAAAARLGVAKLPLGVGWGPFYGVTVLTGIGFTMSLFIGTLAFNDPAHAVEVRLGVLGGSLLSALFGYALLYFTLPAGEGDEAAASDSPGAGARPAP